MAERHPGEEPPGELMAHRQASSEEMTALNAVAQKGRFVLVPVIFQDQERWAIAVVEDGQVHLIAIALNPVQDADSIHSADGTKPVAPNLKRVLN
jgi:hypothetical protein